MVNLIIGWVLTAAVSLGGLLYMHTRVNSGLQKIYELQVQIDAAHQQSIELIKRYDIAKKNADAEMKKFRDETTRIANEKVPVDCAAAVSWGIEKAKGL